MIDEKTGIDENLSVLEDIDFDQACETHIHQNNGAGKVVALVTVKQPCCGYEGSGFACVGCLNYMITSTDGCYCDPPGGCGETVYPYKDTVKSVKYI